MVIHRHSKLLICIIITIIGCIVVSAVFQSFSQNYVKKYLKIFHAGSLAKTFEALEHDFEIKNNKIDVVREVGGSAEIIRRVTDLGKTPDLLCSADYSLIDDFMIMHSEKYAHWNIMFARNKLVIAYTENSKYGSEITAHNWFYILNKSDVKFGFSNPNQDPCGYRALMLIQLAEIYYNKSDIFDNLIASHSTITAVEKDKNFTIKVPENIEWDAKLMIRPKSVELLAHLEIGAIDYAFEYLAVASTHKGLKYITLPSEIDLSTVIHKDFYKVVSVVQFSDTNMKKTIIAKPIVYGLTIPSDAENKDSAIQFVKYMFTDGIEILKQNGFEPIVPPETEYFDILPSALKEYVTKS